MNRLYWTQEDDQLLEKYYQNQVNMDTMMQQLNRTKGAITARAARLGLTKKYIKKNNVNYKAEYQDYDWIYDKYIIQGMNPQEISNTTGYPVRVLQKWIHEKYHLNFSKDAFLNDIQYMIILSGTLGDGHITKKDHASYIESHAENQKDYLFWKYDILKNICLSEPSYYAAKYKDFDGKDYLCQPYYRLTTREIACLCPIRDMSTDKKIMQLDELGFVTHFLDDASYSGINWIICLAEMSQKDKELYINRMNELFNIKSHILKDERYVILDKPSSNIMNDMILKNIPNDIDIIKDKIIKKR